MRALKFRVLAVVARWCGLSYGITAMQAENNHIVFMAFAASRQQADECIEFYAAARAIEASAVCESVRAVH